MDYVLDFNRALKVSLRRNENSLAVRIKCHATHSSVRLCVLLVLLMIVIF
jgi:hypothetical protein